MRLRLLAFAIGVGSLALVGCNRDQQATTNGDGATALADAAVKHGPVNELPIPKDVVDKAINPEKLPEYKGPTGVVEGNVYVTGDPSPPLMGKEFDKCPSGADTYSKAFREGPPLPNGSRILADAILGITGYAGFIVPEKQPSRVMTINGCAYSARSIDMTFGQALEVKNENAGPLMAPYFENQPSPAVLLATPGGDPVRLYPKNPGRYRLIDRVGNSWLEADVFVSVTSLHATSDIKGHYRIEGVPVGKMTLNAWHPAIAHPFDQPIDVRDGVVTAVDVTIPNDKPATRPASRGLKPIFH